MSAPKRLLVPLDYSTVSETKLPTVEEYGLALDAEIILLHVLPNNGRGEGHLPRPFVDTRTDTSFVSPEEARARTFLEMVASRLRAAGVATQPMILYGPVAETIIETARREGISLIILGSDVRNGISRLFAGSVAGRVVRGAPCPILLIQPDLDTVADNPPLRIFEDDAARAGLTTPRILGNRTVETARIIGSVGRSKELGADFRPAQRVKPDEERYQRILKLLGEGVTPLPPIDLYKLGYGYYVLDGHRRVAAAKELGQDEIEANVTEYLPVTDTDAQQLFTARRTFERATGLTSVGAARAESYPQLERLIEEFQRGRGLTEHHEAASRWRVSVYGNLIRRIRALRLNRFFPGERSADIVVRVAKHRAAMCEHEGRDITWDEALYSFIADLDAARR
jgi:nucleotide-binding universal stress UspA family protein